MKIFLKAIFFLIILTILDFLLRKGLLAFFIPFQLPQFLVEFILFTLFTLSSWLVTKWFCKKDKITLKDLGITFNTRNRLEFYLGFIIGVVLWAIVSFSQAFLAGFSWELKPDVSIINVAYGLIFIFIADLGTELFTRGYPLKTFEKSVGSNAAIIIMMFFVGLKSYSSQVEGDLLFYTILIPFLHTIFFSIIYLKTSRLGASLGMHTGANFITISIFDLRPEQENQVIPPGVFQSSLDLETLSLTALQLPWVIMALIVSIVVYVWWGNDKKQNKMLPN